MNQEVLRILLVDDDMTVRATLFAFLKKDFTVFLAEDPGKALSILRENEIDMVISDIRMPGMNGLDFLKVLKSEFPSTEVIMISSHAESELVIDAFRKGAIDFFKKPFDLQELKICIERSQRFLELNKKLETERQGKSRLKKELESLGGITIVGQSPAIMDMKKMIASVAASRDTSVMITGESGTGKELVARAIHNSSERKDEYFAAVNTSSISQELFESEFFGHKKGSFTGAIADRKGWFEIADGGSIFLDEIGDMPMPLQAKMLRVLEDRKFIRLGSQKEEQFDVRIIAATNKNMEEMRGGQNFRTDLYHRLASFEIHVPPLRERREDIRLLTDYFLTFFNEKLRRAVSMVEPEVYAILENYDFPGNIRELRNIIERAVILSPGEKLSASHISVNGRSTGNGQESHSEDFDLERIEKETIIRALRAASYNKMKAAELLRIKWNALHRRMEKFGIGTGA